MNAAKSSSKPPGKIAGRASRVLQTSLAAFAPRHQLLWALAALAAVVGGGLLLAWKNWGGAVSQHPSYVVTADAISITPPPEWVHSDVKAEVIRDGSLEKLPLLDPQLTVKVARAFAVHTWVAQVKRVSKQSNARIIVDLEYRRPVAMVEVNDNGQPGLVPVDSQGVVLPPEDFASETRNYLRIFAGDTVPAGPVGTPWGDERVLGGAAVTALLTDSWRKLNLYRLQVTAANLATRKPTDLIYELETRDRVRIVWGRAPGREAGNETTAAEKVARLQKFAEQHGPFSADRNADYDLREKTGLVVTPRPPATVPDSQ